MLEAGCGVGAQTVTLARNSPGALITSIDIAEASLAEAAKAVRAAGIRNVTLRHADLFAQPFGPASFDHVFVCFVLEHLERPAEALGVLQGFLRPGGTITVIEGDHGSAYFHPRSGCARRDGACLVDLQRHAGGDAMIGRTPLPAGRRGRVRGGARVAAHRLRRRRAIPRSWTASPARPSPR